jgi:uncharacterized protein (TIGR02588 family)
VSRRPAERTRSRTERLEWLLGAVAGIVVLAVIGFLAFEGLTRGGIPPDLTVAAETPAGAAAPELRFTLTNRGGRAATGVVVALTLRDGAEVAEVRRLTVEEVAPGSTATGAFLLPPDAGRLTPALTIEGYLDP